MIIVMNAKKMAQLFSAINALPMLIEYRIACKLIGKDRALSALSEKLSLRTGMSGLYLRQACYRRVLKHVGQDVYIGFMSQLSKTTAVICDRVYIGRFCTIGSVIMEEDVMLADHVQLLSGSHQHGDSQSDGLLRENQHIYQTITIGKGAWIGAGSVVMADVGAGAIVGAGAVVTRPVAAGDRVAGVPAKSIIKPTLAKAG
ncbi:MAG TPA: acetyltransferase [Phycisphaerales bacterium]|nr:acetyltransferase [Phycisphaerales bacterium]HCD35353.1 acetyltransferase [Phycisphaerales bacterium]|tara:strand:- start:2469 stop:3071 length:603 start_codon:yes stop_codon:yes gene_type:complete